ncbi:hypothetical protein R1flu_008153 [Riccia fluitans]|uniref:Uncharacterized protein n=1 Tax=Riccia fluitans TaxID=41844 RepID=A0ABD1YAV4_9MARC
MKRMTSIRGERPAEMGNRHGSSEWQEPQQWTVTNGPISEHRQLHVADFEVIQRGEQAIVNASKEYKEPSARLDAQARSIINAIKESQVAGVTQTRGLGTIKHGKGNHYHQQDKPRGKRNLCGRHTWEP